MFRLSDYDFEYGEKDYVAFMDLVKKFLTCCREINEPMRGYFTEDEMIDNAENLALEYIEMRKTKVVSNTIAEFVETCEIYLGYNAICEQVVDDSDKYDDTLWNIYGDLS
jgi:5'-deoxynucleotidase YfbR-like HD superfamily hydrolase